MIDLNRMRVIVSALIFINAFAIEPLIAQQRPHSSKAANLKVDRKVIEADIEKYRRGESPTIESAYELTNCTEAFPLLQKYALDPDSKVRELITDYVGRHSSPQRLQLLVQQIEKYPLKNAAIRYAYRYSCRSFSQIRKRSLAAALISRIKEDPEDVHRNEIYILRCLVGRDLQARRFLEEMRGPSFSTRLNARLREYQLFEVNLALAEVRQPDAVRDALTRIDEESNRATYDELKALVEQVREISNVDILRRLSEFIRDKKEGPGEYGGIRIGDVAAGVFTPKLGSRVTGDKQTDNWFRHADQELEQIYKRVKSHLEKQNRRSK